MPYHGLARYDMALSLDRRGVLNTGEEESERTRCDSLCS